MLPRVASNLSVMSSSSSSSSGLCLKKPMTWLARLPARGV
jgi:hypothetical protein